MSSFYNWCLEHSKYWLLTEWDYAKNLPLTPSTCSRGSDKKVWWICQNGHEWQTHICYRAKCFRPCPICAKTHTLVKGVNDLATVNPKLASQWDYEKNSPLKPNDVLPRSMKKVWWICEKGHNFEATIDNRTKGSGCPLCSHERKTSFPEKAVCYYLSKFFPDIKYNHKTPWLGKSEIDIFIPSLNLAIEYDGERWHQNIKKDLKKDCLLKNHSIKVIRIREPGCPDMKNDCLCIKTEKPISDGSHVIPAIKKLFLFINKTFSLNFMPSVNFTKDTADILNGYYHQVKLHSLSSENPSLAKEWDYEKNGKLTPSMVFPNSGKKAWWKCEKGHEWAAVIASRNNGVGCPYCSGRKVQKGFNDLKTKRPDIALEWDYLKNDITPEDVTSSSNKKVWWKCSVCGREWESKINNRTSSLHTGCPYCAKELNKQSRSA